MRGNVIITAGPESASPIKPVFGNKGNHDYTSCQTCPILQAQNLGNLALLEVFTAAQTLRFWKFKSLIIDKNCGFSDNKCKTQN